MNRSPFLGLALAMAVGLGACDSTDPLGPTADDTLDAIIAAASRGPDDNGDRDNHEGPRGPGGFTLFEELADEIPSFGGLYRVSSCHVVVVLTDMDEADHAVAVVEDLVQPVVGNRCPNGVTVEAEAGDYTFLELRDYLMSALQLVRVGVAASAWIDFEENRLIVRVEPGTEDAVAEALEDAGVPLDAVIFTDESGRPGQAPPEDDRD